MREIKEKEYKQKLNDAIKLLEKCYGVVNHGAQYDAGGLHLLPDRELRNEITTFVKSVKKNSSLRLYKIEPMVILAC